MFTYFHTISVCYGVTFDFLSKMDNIPETANFWAMAMQTVTSGKVQASFGEVADIAKGGEPVTVTQYGRPTLLIMRYQDGIEALRAASAKRMGQWLDTREKDAPRAAREVSLEALNTMIDEERNK